MSSWQEGLSSILSALSLWHAIVEALLVTHFNMFYGGTKCGMWRKTNSCCTTLKMLLWFYLMLLLNVLSLGTSQKHSRQCFPRLCICAWDNARVRSVCLYVLNSMDFMLAKCVVPKVRKESLWAIEFLCRTVYILEACVRECESSPGKFHTVLFAC